MASKKVFTAYDARREKHAADARMFAKQDRQEAAKKAADDVVRSDRRIGVLTKANGKPAYYAHHEGVYSEHKDPAAIKSWLDERDMDKGHNRTLKVANPNASEMAHHFEDAE